MAWFSLFGRVPDNRGGSAVRDTKPFVFSADIRKHLDSTYTFLNQAKVIDVDKAPDGAIDDSFAQAVLKDAGATSPLGEIKALDASQAPKE